VSSLASVSVLRNDVTVQVLTHYEPKRSKILVTGRQNFYKVNGVLLKGYSTHDIEHVIQMTQGDERKDEGDKDYRLLGNPVVDNLITEHYKSRFKMNDHLKKRNVHRNLSNTAWVGGSKVKSYVNNS
jgi:hypothetical protein